MKLFIFLFIISKGIFLFAEQNLHFLKPLMNLVGHVESDSYGGYEAANKGRPLDLGKNGLISVSGGKRASEITLGEILFWQKNNVLHAAGRYQIIGSTLNYIYRFVGLSLYDTFSQNNQDLLFAGILRFKRPKVWDYLFGKSSLEVAQIEMAKEWAGLPCPDGHSFYPLPNKAKISSKQLAEALKKTKLLVLKNL